MRPAALLLRRAEPVPHGVEAPLVAGVLLALLICAATRLLVWTAAYSGAVLHVRIIADVEPPLTWHTRAINAALADEQSVLSRALRERVANFLPLMHWDAGHYHSIIENGYSYKRASLDLPAAERQSNIAFFPLFPALCVPLTRAVSTYAAMMLVANAAALAAAGLIYIWMRRRAGHAEGLAAVAVTFLWPTACFHSFGYPESLTLLLIAATLLLADRGRWPAAAIACGLATAARPTAICLVPLLIAMYWIRSAQPIRRRALAASGLGIVALGGALAYGAYLTWRFDSPLVYADNLRDGWLEGDRGSWPDWLLGAQVWAALKHLPRALLDLPAGLVHLVNPLTWNMPVSLALLVASGLAWRRVPADFRPLLLLGPLIFLQRYLAAGWSSFALESLGRYLAIALPTLAIAGVWLWREASVGTRVVILMSLALLQAAWALAFGLGEWAG